MAEQFNPYDAADPALGIFLNRASDQIGNSRQTGDFFSSDESNDRQSFIKEIPRLAHYFRYLTGKRLSEPEDVFGSLGEITRALKSLGFNNIEVESPAERARFLFETAAKRYANQSGQSFDFAKQYMFNSANDEINNPKLRTFWE